jgi:signal transduction histidine kinase
MYRVGIGGWRAKASGIVEQLDQRAERRYIIYCGRLHRLVPFWSSGLPSTDLADYLHYQGVNGGANMALSNQEVIQELRHEIHSPLAAIRNALYLAAARSTDSETLHYLELADAEISRIAAVLKNANQIDENKEVHVLIPFMDAASAA